MKTYVFGLVLWAAAIFAVITLATVVPTEVEPSMRPVPRCQEDQVLVGTGDFEAGRWDRYVCGPAFDDYTPQEAP